MYGGAKSDNMYGEAGEDVMYGGTGGDNMYGGAKSDVMYGEVGKDNMYGGTGGDVMYGGSDSDDMYGEAGEDIMYGGTGGDNMYGGTGGDVMYGEAGTDLMYGESGDDTLYGGDDADVMYGGAGNDEMHGEEGTDLMYGGTGSVDVMYGGTEADMMFGDSGQGGEIGDDDIMYGGAGNDDMLGEGGADLMYGGSGYDEMSGGFADDTMSGGAGNDFMIGDSWSDGPEGDPTVGGDDVMYGGADSDDMFGQGGDDLMYGGSGHDELAGGHGNDVMYGGTGADYMDGGSGNDVMSGGTGRDYMDGGFGNDVMDGGDDDDDMYGNFGNDVMSGGAGNDFMVGGRESGPPIFGEDDVMYGGAGNDVMIGDNLEHGEEGHPFEGGVDLMYGGAGKDEMYGQGGDDVMYGGAGEDEMSGGFGNDVMDGGTEGDFMTGSFGNDTMHGGDGNDAMFGDDPMSGGYGNSSFGPADDVMYGGAGNDLVVGMGGDDLMYGGADQDEMFGEDGKDTMHGGEGHDLIVGGDGDDLMYGGAGSDEMVGGDDHDVMYGGTGIDEMFGGSGNDLMFGGADADEMEGGSGNDTMFGNDGTDGLIGSGDVIDGNSGDDEIHGEGGNDTLDGGSGNDTVNGGAGDDVMKWSYGENSGDTDHYDGGTGVDCLELYFTAAEFAAYETEIAEFANLVEDHNHGILDIGGRTLNVESVTYVKVFVDGHEVPVLLDDTLGTGEDTDMAAVSITIDNDFIPNSATTTYDMPGDVTLTMPVPAPDPAVETVHTGWVETSLGSNVWELTIPGYGEVTFDATDAEDVQVSLDINPVDDAADGDSGFDPLAVGEQATVVFDYTASLDGSSGSETGTVTIEVGGVNDDPTMVDGIGYVLEDADPILVDLSVLADDIDNDDTGATLTYSIVTAPLAGQGTASIIGTDLQFNPGSDFQELAEEEDTTVTVQVMATDSHTGTSNVVDIVITVVGTNDAPVMSASIPSIDDVSEDDGSVEIMDLSTLGSDIDSDDDAASLSYSIAPGGDPAEGTASVLGSVLSFNPGLDFQDLNDGETREVTIEVLATDSHLETSNVVEVTFLVMGSNDAAEITGDISATLVEDDIVVEADGQLYSADVDNTDDAFQVNFGPTSYGEFTVNASGYWTYELDSTKPAVDALNVGDELEDTFTVKSEDGTEQVITITIEGVNDAATITGSAMGEVTEDEAPGTVSGDLHSADVDNTDDAFQEVTTDTTSDDGYGTYTVTAAGVWTYTLDNTHPDVDDLDDGEELTDTFTVLSEDGTPKEVTITINGATDNSPPFANTDYIVTNHYSAGFWVADALLTGNDTDVDGDALELNAVRDHDNVDASNDEPNDRVRVWDAHDEGHFHYRVTDGDDTAEGAVYVDYQGSANLNGGGADVDQILVGHGGDNRIHGGGGDDTLIGGAGEDTLHGDAGNDTVYYGDLNSGVYVDLDYYSATWGRASADGDMDYLENIENVIGSQGTDYIYGSNGANQLDGEGGNDYVAGYGGNDTLTGGDGNDTLIGGSGDDTLIGGAGDDWMDARDGGGENDTYVFLGGDNGEDTINDYDITGGNQSAIDLDALFDAMGLTVDERDTAVDTGFSDNGGHAVLSITDGSNSIHIQFDDQSLADKEDIINTINVGDES
ncbi:hypothetical protein A9Q83_12845 [Alphaproteobacteria bacterium 46_93_T64]|nr:hypothetical protein A9Q83_12845 [Alphaproteobacteria bacterium 46_93_T64]